MESRSIFLALLLFAATGAVAGEAYRWVAEDGVVHFSDRPRPGAERIVLPEPNVATTRRPSYSAATSTTAGESPEEPFKYDDISIVVPAAEETLWNIEGVLNVSVSLTPSLQAGHQLRAYHNGQAQLVRGTSFELQEVWRGVHNIQVEVLDETGKLMIRSRPNRFYVQQNNVAF